MVKEAKYRMTRLMSLGGTADDPWSRIPRETPYRAGTTPNSAIVAGCVSEAIRWRCPEGVVIIAVELLYGTDCRQTFTYRHIGLGANHLIGKCPVECPMENNLTRHGTRYCEEICRDCAEYFAPDVAIQ